MPTERRGRLLLLAALILLSACQREVPIHTERLLAMGTIIEISLWGVPPEQATPALAAVEHELQALHQAWHPWAPGPMQQTNERLASTDWFEADLAVLPLIESGKRLSAASGGLFNPAIGRLIALWGWHQDERPAGLPPPDPAAIERLLAARPGMDDVLVDGPRLRSTNPAVQLDMGALAKGAAVDRVVEQLRARGIDNAIVNAGGDLRAIGRPGARPWRIGIRQPRGEGVLAALEVSGDESVFTSGDYERYFVHQGTRYHHILDPRSGYPARGSISVTLLGPDATTADAAATALFVAGPQAWPEVAQAMGISAVMLVAEDGHIELSPAMAERIVFDVEPERVTVLEPR